MPGQMTAVRLQHTGFAGHPARATRFLGSPLEMIVRGSWGRTHEHIVCGRNARTAGRALTYEGLGYTADMPAPRLVGARQAEVAGHPLQLPAPGQRRQLRHARQPLPPLARGQLPDRVEPKRHVVPHVPRERRGCRCLVRRPDSYRSHWLAKSYDSHEDSTHLRQHNATVISTKVVFLNFSNEP